jgi:hypothetical protein
LDTAYQKGLVPTHLHGRTQHKTLQARIAEDIIDRRESSLFYRTQPGKFFLRRFLMDESLPEDFRTVFPTRRRIRELVRGPALAIDYDDLDKAIERNVPIKLQKILDLLNADRFRYGDPRQERKNLVFLRSFVCLYRDHEVLSYRAGRYRENRDSFLLRRSIGFSTFVHAEERTLFNLSDFGVIESGVRATRIDLDIPETQPAEPLEAKLGYFIWPSESDGQSDLLAVVEFKCPSWFEPLKRRLALNDLSWLDMSKPVNDINDFDPWSKLILLAHFKSYSRMDNEIGPHSPYSGQAKRRISQIPD